MAGSNSAFSATAFRSAIHTAMTMGAANSPATWVTFRFTEVATYKIQDPANNPYSWTEPTATDTPQSDVVVPCAVTFARSRDAAEPMGQFDLSKASITILDTDYATIVGFNQVLINGEHYVVDAPGPIPQGLFDVTVWTVNVTARG